MVLLTTPRVMVSFGLRTFKLRFSVCHSSDTSLAADGVKYAFQARRLLALHCTHESFIYTDHHLRHRHHHQLFYLVVQFLEFLLLALSANSS